jgi:hypothetical protein
MERTKELGTKAPTLPDAGMVPLPLTRRSPQYPLVVVTMENSVMHNSNLRMAGKRKRPPTVAPPVPMAATVRNILGVMKAFHMVVLKHPQSMAVLTIKKTSNSAKVAPNPTRIA